MNKLQKKIIRLQAAAARKTVGFTKNVRIAFPHLPSEPTEKVEVEYNKMVRQINVPFCGAKNHFDGLSDAKASQMTRMWARQPENKTRKGYNRHMWFDGGTYNVKLLSALLVASHRPGFVCHLANHDLVILGSIQPNHSGVGFNLATGTILHQLPPEKALKIVATHAAVRWGLDIIRLLPYEKLMETTAPAYSGAITRGTIQL